MRRSWEEPMDVLSNYADSYCSLGEFISFDQMMEEFYAVTPEAYDQLRKRVIGQLQGVYLLAGKTEGFVPHFPARTWNGKFIESQ